MGQSIGDAARHIVMNEMMKRMMGEPGEEQMHAVMGKRLSGCNTSVAFPSQDVGFMPMMQMMMGGMNFGCSPFGGFGWGFLILLWGLIIAGIVALIRWFASQSRGTH